MSYNTLSNKFFIRPFSKGFYNSKSYEQEQDFRGYNAGFKTNSPAGPSEARFLAGGSVHGARLAETGLHCSLSTSSHFTAPALRLSKTHLSADRPEEGSGLPMFFGSFPCSFQLSERPQAALCYVLLSVVPSRCFCQCRIAGWAQNHCTSTALPREPRFSCAPGMILPVTFSSCH